MCKLIITPLTLNWDPYSDLALHHAQLSKKIRHYA